MNIFALAIAAISSVSQPQFLWDSTKTDKGSLLYSDESVTIRGSWIAHKDYPGAKITKINTSSISCSRKAAECIESIAFLSPLACCQSDGAPHLLVATFRYRIESWQEKTIIAKRENPGIPVNSVLKIDGTAGSVLLDWIATPDSDLGTFNPSEQHYHMNIESHFGV